MTKLYSSYEKTVLATVTKTTHTVRIRLNETAVSVKKTLNNVPNSAIVAMVTDDSDSEFDGSGEIIFTEEVVIKD